MGARAFLSLVVGSLCLVGSFAGHTDMFSCRSGKNCAVTEITDQNWDTELKEPTFMMFYAPWCGHCKVLAPKLKKAAKALGDVGIKVGACDVEPNRGVQSKFPDIKGFPTLKFVTDGKKPKKALDYNGEREDGAIVEFCKSQAKSLGLSLGEAVPTKTNAELYTYFGRAALDNLPALVLVGDAKTADAPKWVSKMAGDLRKIKKDTGKPNPEDTTRDLVKQAIKATKVKAAKEGLQDVLSALDDAEKSGAQGPPVVSPAYVNDAAAVELLGLSPSELPALFFASIDRKTGTGNYVRYSGSVKDSKGKIDSKPIIQFVTDLLPHAATPDTLASHAGMPGDARPLPAFPKPAAVLAAEARAEKRKAEAGSIAAVNDAATLDKKCYKVEGKTCAMLLVRGGAGAASGEEGLAGLAKKYSRDGFVFAAIDSDDAALTDLVLGLGGEMAMGSQSLAVVKTGKRPRVAAVTGGASDFESLLDSVVGGGASFKKLSDGLPTWPVTDEEDDLEGSFSDDEL